MKWKFYWREALNNLWLSKLRSILAIIGILVGSAAVVTLVSIGEMAKYKALSEFKTLGMNLASLVVNQNMDFNAGIDLTRTLIPDYNYAQSMLTLATKVANIQEVAPVATLSLPAYYAGKKLEAPIIATTYSYQTLANLQIQEGRFLHRLDRNNYFCVVGSDIANQLKNNGSNSIIGKELQLGNAYFTVIGSIKPWIGNAFISNNVNGSVFISLAAAHNFAPNLYIDTTLLQLKPDSDPDQIETDVKNFLAAKFPGLEVTVKTGKQLIVSMTHQKNVFTWMLGLIGGIALLVGGIGIMNVMLVSVTERRREIGIRLAIGARRADIQIMFLCEAIILATIGGVTGIIISLFITRIVAEFLTWEFMFSGSAVLIGFFVSLFTGIFFGIYPAYQASKLNPIDVLRAE
ncbi:MAG: macB [Gammaproteobacteria bacterium]|jgi:putative ABC transport system permease protein|nr:macB [Gammaproteobacteria bacterium]